MGACMSIQLNKGDCLGDNGMKTIADKTIDMICADLPYGITGNRWDNALNLEGVFAEYMRIIKDNGCIALFSCQPFTTDLINAGREWFRYELIWDKKVGTDFFNANRKPLRSHENILIFWKQQPKYNPQMEEGKPYQKKSYPDKVEVVSSIGEHNKFRRLYIERINTGTRFPKTIISFAKEQGLHTTQKPVKLLEWLIQTYTDEGELVLDNTMGSGSCAVACKNTNRRFVGWELDEKIFETANCRVLDCLTNEVKDKGD